MSVREYNGSPQAAGTSFGERLAQMRKQRGLSQDQLGERTGFDKRVISRYETGRNVPSIEVARTLADALGVSLDHLTGLDYSLFVDDAELRGLLRDYEELPAEDRMTIKRLLRAFRVYTSVERKQRELAS